MGQTTCQDESRKTVEIKNNVDDKKEEKSGRVNRSQDEPVSIIIENISCHLRSNSSGVEYYSSLIRFENGTRTEQI